MTKQGPNCARTNGGNSELSAGSDDRAGETGRVAECVK